MPVKDLEVIERAKSCNFINCFAEKIQNDKKLLELESENQSLKAQIKKLEGSLLHCRKWNTYQVGK